MGHEREPETNINPLSSASKTGPHPNLGKPRGGTMVRPSNRMGSVPGPTLWAKLQSAHATCLKATQHAIEAFTSRDETQEKMCQHARCATGAEGVQLVGKLTDGWKVGYGFQLRLHDSTSMASPCARISRTSSSFPKLPVINTMTPSRECCKKD